MLPGGNEIGLPVNKASSSTPQANVGNVKIATPAKPSNSTFSSKPGPLNSPLQTNSQSRLVPVKKVQKIKLNKKLFVKVRYSIEIYLINFHNFWHNSMPMNLKQN